MGISKVNSRDVSFWVNNPRELNPDPVANKVPMLGGDMTKNQSVDELRRMRTPCHIVNAKSDSAKTSDGPMH